MEYTDLIGFPFGYGGRSLADGCLDCYGVVVEMGRRNGQTFPTRQFSESHLVNHALMAGQMSEWRRIDQPKAGAVVLLRVLRHPCHVGYLINEFEFVHAWEHTNGVVVERLSEWERRIEGFYEYAG